MVPVPGQCLSAGASSAKCLHHLLTRPFSRQATIEKLSDKVLLNIFCSFLDDSPRDWPTLMHICCKWRSIVFASQRTLQLRLLLTHGASILKTLDCWPTLSIDVRYEGSPGLDPPTPEDESNIMAALKHSDRVTSIWLTVTRSLLERVFANEMQFSGLEDLVLLSRDRALLTLPSTFRCGPHLRTLHFTGIAFPALPRLLSSSRDLVDIQLHEIPDIGYISPESLRNALSGMSRLRSLSLRFHSLHSLSAADYIELYPPSGKHVVLPTLTCLTYQGTSEYLDSLVARIDAPSLRDVAISFFNEFIYNVSNIRLFINRIEMQKSHRQSDILFSEHSISISLTQPAPTCLKLQVLCEQLGQQLYSIARSCSLLSSFFLCVEDLRIEATRPLSRQDGTDSVRWVELIRSFSATKRFHLNGDFSTDVFRALEISGSLHKTVLPALHKLYIPQPSPRHAPLREAVASLMTSRSLSGHPIAVEYERLCNISEAHGAGTMFLSVTTITR